MAFRPIADLGAGARQASTLRHRDHRPWPLPRRPWFMGQTWERLLFAHWELSPERLRALIPSELPLDTFEGRAFVGVTPFEVRALRLTLTPPLPWVSHFPELNVRTYVTVGGRPGIYFFSLDAARLTAVHGARRSYRVPYHHARMTIHRDGPHTRFESARISRDGPPAELRAEYEPTRPAYNPAPETLEHWLTERYCLYTMDQTRRVLRGEIHHPPWPLRPARAELELNTMGAQIGLGLAAEPLLHYAGRQDVLFWRLAPAD